MPVPPEFEPERIPIFKRQGINRQRLVSRIFARSYPFPFVFQESGYPAGQCLRVEKFAFFPLSGVHDIMVHSETVFSPVMEIPVSLQPVHLHGGVPDERT